LNYLIDVVRIVQRHLNRVRRALSIQAKGFGKMLDHEVLVQVPVGIYPMVEAISVGS
jgi:hypothetical protein